MAAALAAVLCLLVCPGCCRCCCCCSDDGNGYDRAREEKEMEGFYASLFLVLGDCVTCCRAGEKKGGHVRADDVHFRASPNSASAAAAAAADRHRRATSVQRQTDTLRRLAQQRDVTPR